jgi:hypothetical protein
VTADELDPRADGDCAGLSATTAATATATATTSTAAAAANGTAVAVSEAARAGEETGECENRERDGCSKSCRAHDRSWAPRDARCLFIVRL